MDKVNYKKKFHLFTDARMLHISSQETNNIMKNKTRKLPVQLQSVVLVIPVLYLLDYSLMVLNEVC
jgi:hypothetical protein